MKVLLVVIFVSFLDTLNAEFTKEQLKEMADALLQECKKDTKAKDEDFVTFKEKKLPSSHEGLCMVECFLDKIGMMSNGKFDKEGVVEALATIIKDDNEMKALKSSADYCHTKIGEGAADKCENAKLIISCLVEGGKKHGFDFVKYSIG